MASKRKGPELAGSVKKRQKLQNARQIDVEREPIGNAPASLNIDDFIKSRAFEITAMENTIKASKKASSQRVFQTLPRELRRRAASHNTKKIPLRFRQKALREISADAVKSPKKLKTRHLPRLKKLLRKRTTRMQVLERRATKNGWLPSHLWHGKRMKMIKKWGHTIASTPNQKSYRSSYRAAKHGSLVYDASYMSYICLQMAQYTKAPGRFLNVLAHHMNPLDKPDHSFPPGRSFSFIFYAQNKFPDQAICPLQLFETKREFWLQVHPSCTEKVMQELQKSFTDYASEHSTLKLKTFNTFEILGAHAGNTAQSVLKLSKAASREDIEALHAVENPDCVIPEGTVIALEVMDPRYDDVARPTSDKALPHCAFLLPSAILAKTDSHSSALLMNKVSLPSKSQLDQERNKLKQENPGKTRLLSPANTSTAIPALLFRRAPSAAPFGSRVKVGSNLSGYTLILPEGCGGVFWNKLVETASRVIGLKEWKDQHIEAGLPYFPDDWLPTAAGQTEAKLLAAEIQDRISAMSIKQIRKDARKQMHTYNEWPSNVTRSPFLCAGQFSTRTRSALTSSRFLDLIEPPEQADEFAFRGIYTNESVSCAWFIVRLTAISGRMQPGAALLYVDLPEKVLMFEKKEFSGRPKTKEREDIQSQLYKEAWSEPGLTMKKIGYVTSANYALSIGRSCGFGSISHGNFKQMKELKSYEGFCLVWYRNPNQIAEHCAKLEFLY